MKPQWSIHSVKAWSMAALAMLAVFVAAPNRGMSATQFLSDGAQPNGITAGWDLPTQGSCLNYPTATNRPDCLALRLNPAPFDKTTCQASPTLGTWATSGVCNDLVNTTAGSCVSVCSNPAYLDRASCEENHALWIARIWNAAKSICAIAMEDADRNAVICAKSHGNWITAGSCVGTWVFPAASSYNPPLLNTTSSVGTSATSTGPSPGDQCLRCHNSTTQYNGARVRDVEDTLYMGHRNMSRKVVPGNAWGGPPLSCSNPGAGSEDECEALNAHWYPTSPYLTDDQANPFNWATGQITIGGGPANLYWIFADWLSPLPRSIYSAGSSGMTGKPLMSYSCSRCHTTGWTSDAAINGSKEPETSFPGVTWDGTTLNTTSKVNLAGGVSGDTNKYSSWDQFGIQCSRCHGSAIDNASNGGVRPFTAPAGMSTHHSNLTSADTPAGCSLATCAGTRCTIANCASSGGTWYYGFCTDSRFLTGGVTAAAAKTACETAGGANIEPAPGSGMGVWITPCSDNNFGDQAGCVGAGGTWNLGTSSCSVAGLCNNIAGGPYTDQASCTGASLANCPGGVACQWAATSDIVSCIDADGHYTGTYANRGQVITSLCMQCHRQETSGQPYADTGNGIGSGSTSHPGTYVKVGAYHSTVTYPSHPHGNMFLNSPHGKFTGSSNQIATAAFGNGYGSFFQFKGEASGTGNGCTGCHNPHRSTVEGAGIEEPVKPCQECHSGQFAVDLTKINHLATAGTPLDPATVGTDESAPCITCHMPNGEHMFRINPDENYSTFPMPAALSSVVNANTSPDGTFTNAVWVDLDAACGQCHGGGTAQATTTLTAPTSTASSTLTVASTVGFQVGQHVRVADAGNFVYDEVDYSRGNFDSYIASITPPNTLVVVGPPPISVASGKTVIQNPTKNGAVYRTKATLAKVAEGMHSSAKIPANITFTMAVNGLSIVANAQVTCGATPCPPLTYDWDWGDGTPNGSGDPANHTYATGGSKHVTLVVKLDSMNANNTIVGSLSRNVSLAAANGAPSVSGTMCSFDADKWLATVKDASVDTDANGVGVVIAEWGDGAVRGVGSQGQTFTHTYILPGTYTPQLRAFDTALKASPWFVCPPVTTAYFTISGTVNRHDGTTPVSGASVIIRNSSAVAVKSTYTASNGLFSVGGLKPGGYTVVVARRGYTFPSVAAITVGPSSSGTVINATTP